MVKVKLHGELGQEIGEDWNLEVSSVAEAFRAIEANTRKLTKFLVLQAEKNAKYEILINNRPLWVPKAEDLPLDYKDVKKEHFSMLQQSEMCMDFGKQLKTIDIVPILEGAGGGGGGGGGGGCFPAGTKISTPQGVKNIEDLKEGDEILSFNKDKNIEIDVIEKVFEHENNKILKITLWGGSVIRATPNHWFFNEYNRFTPLENFKVGDVLIHESGDVMPIEKIEEDGNEKVYNFHVFKNHTYIANNIFVHNGGGGKGGGGKGGAGGGGMKSIFSVFLAIMLAPLTGGSSLGLMSILMPAILGLVALGVSMLLMKPPPMVSPQSIANPSADFEASPDSGGGEPSYTFNGPVNTVGEGGPIPLGYGRLIIGSHQVFSSYDQIYRIQSRNNVYESDGKAPIGIGAGEKNYPTKSYYFDTQGYPITIQTPVAIDGSVSQSSLSI